MANIKQMQQEAETAERYAAHYDAQADAHRAAGSKHLCGTATAARNLWRRRAAALRAAITNCPAQCA